jgi:glycine cleavage system H protein
MKLLGFDYPADRWYCLERDLWVLPMPPTGLRVGITAFGVHISGSFFMCRPKPAGTELHRGDTLAVLELNKSVVTIKSPVSGVVRAVNPALADHPELIEQSPHDQGWLVELCPTDWAHDQTRLHHGPGLAQAALTRMRLEPDERFQGPQ